MNGSKAGGDLALMQTSLLFSCKCKPLASEQLDLQNKSSKICIKTRSPPASLPFKGLVTKQTTVKWSIGSELRIVWFEQSLGWYNIFLITLTFVYDLSEVETRGYVSLLPSNLIGL